MIFAVGSDQCRVSVASDGAITGQSTLCPGGTWDTKLGIKVAIMRMYVGRVPDDVQHDMKHFKHYYVVKVNMAMTAELISRACTYYGSNGLT